MPRSTARLQPVRASHDASDAELVARSLAGDRVAQEQIFRRHAAGVAQLVDRIVRHREDADDVLQQTFELALRRLHQLQRPEALRSWLLQIAVRRCQTLFRRRRMRRLLGIESSAEPESLLDDVSPDLTAEQRTEIALLDVALRRVPDRARIAWILRHVEGLSLPECAEACGCSLATVKRRIRAADDVIQIHVGGPDEA
jgi:RNA polymerase sigma-70 factor (ECF subfamily)